jgi:hypothetical protein
MNSALMRLSAAERLHLTQPHQSDILRGSGIARAYLMQLDKLRGREFITLLP